MIQFAIREAMLTDSNAICILNTQAFGYPYPLEKTKQRLAYILNTSPNKLFVACVNDRVVGYIHASDYECTYFNSLKNIMAIAVEEHYRGQRIGKALLDAIESWAIEENCAGVRLVSGMNREKAHDFYLHCGYELRKTQKNFIKYINH